jgi:cytochrome c-type biogenesis protein CcmE
MKIKPVYILAICLVAISAILAYDALTSSINPYLTVSQVVGDETKINKEFQILATVANLSCNEEGTLYITITDGAAAIEVEYAGVPPQGLKVGQKIAAIGSLTTPYRLKATQLLVKCPSKYE